MGFPVSTPAALNFSNFYPTSFIRDLKKTTTATVMSKQKV